MHVDGRGAALGEPQLQIAPAHRPGEEPERSRPNLGDRARPGVGGLIGPQHAWSRYRQALGLKPPVLDELQRVRDVVAHCEAEVRRRGDYTADADGRKHRDERSDDLLLLDAPARSAAVTESM